MRKPSRPSAAGTIFDDVYRTMIQKMSGLIIPVINEAFGTSYDESADLTQLRNEHLELAGKLITDSIFRLGDNLYHLECQSTPDGAMVIRMFEYDFAIAMEEARGSDAPYRVKFPLSAAFYLRHRGNTPDKLALEVVLPNHQGITYEVPVLKVQNYSLEEIFQKKLWIFLPYYIMRYEKEFDAMEKDSSRREAMLKELREMATRLEEYAQHPEHAGTCADLMQLARSVADHMLRNQQRTKKEVSAVMGGKILELHTEKMMRLGRKAGRAEGRVEGRAEGRAEGEGRLSRLMSLLLKSGKTDEAAAAAENPDVRKRLYKEYGIA